MSIPTKYLTFAAAKAYIQGEHITTRAEYFKWHHAWSITKVPKYPFRSYTLEWKGWNDFLGNNNTFNRDYHRKLRTWDEHCVYAKTCGAKTLEEWMMIDHPIDISKRPDAHFKHFCGWNSFLGVGRKAIAAIVEREKLIEQVEELLVFSIHDTIEGTVRVSVHRGRDATVHWIKEKGVRVIKAFVLEENYDWKVYLSKWGADYGNGVYRFDNLNEMLFNIDLQWVR